MYKEVSNATKKYYNDLLINNVTTGAVERESMGTQIGTEEDLCVEDEHTTSILSRSLSHNELLGHTKNTERIIQEAELRNQATSRKIKRDIQDGNDSVITENLLDLDSDDTHVNATTLDSVTDGIHVDNNEDT